MSDAIGDILDSKRFDVPPEVKIIKEFVNTRFQTVPQITVQSRQILIQVPSAALAGALRLQLHQLHQLCRTDKKLVIRIGS